MANRNEQVKGSSLPLIFVPNLQNQLTVKGRLDHHRGYFNEPRNVAIYLIRHLRGDRLKDVGGFFGTSRNSTISSVDRRVKGEMIKNKRLKKTSKN